MYGRKRSYRRLTGCLNSVRRMTQRTEDNKNVMSSFFLTATSLSVPTSHTSVSTTESACTTSTATTIAAATVIVSYYDTQLQLLSLIILVQFNYTLPTTQISNNTLMLE